MRSVTPGKRRSFGKSCSQEAVREIERAFGLERVAPSWERKPELSPELERASGKIRTPDDAEAFFGALYKTQDGLRAAQEKLPRLEWSEERAQVEERFMEGLRQVYREPMQARSRFGEMAVVDGIEPAAATLRASPQSFGELLTKDTRVLGFTVHRDDAEARRYALSTAQLGRELWAARVGMPAPPELEQARQAMRELGERERSMRLRAPEVREAVRDLARAVDELRRQLTPPELRQLEDTSCARPGRR